MCYTNRKMNLGFSLEKKRMQKILQLISEQVWRWVSLYRDVLDDVHHHPLSEFRAFVHVTYVGRISIYHTHVQMKMLLLWMARNLNFLVLMLYIACISRELVREQFLLILKNKMLLLLIPPNSFCNLHLKNLASAFNYSRIFKATIRFIEDLAKF